MKYDETYHKDSPISYITCPKCNSKVAYNPEASTIPKLCPDCAKLELERIKRTWDYAEQPISLPSLTTADLERAQFHATRRINIRPARKTEQTSVLTGGGYLWWDPEPI